jgi:hypothetical protein
MSYCQAHNIQIQKTGAGDGFQLVSPYPLLIWSVGPTAANGALVPVRGKSATDHLEISASPRLLAKADTGYYMNLNRRFQGKPVFFEVPYRSLRT